MENPNNLQRYRYLASKWLDQTITKDELKEFNDWYNTNLDAPLDIPRSFALNEQEIETRISKRLNNKLKGIARDRNRQTRITIKWMARISVAAAILIIVGAGLWFYAAPRRHPKLNTLSQTDIGPGKNMATLTFSNGKTIQLSEKKKGVLIENNKLKYNDGTDVALSAALDNNPNGATTDHSITASTPKGGTYQIVLSDGSHVWLNADSKLVFPSKFTGNQRKVTLTGEAYFEIAKNRAKPFIVNYDESSVEVLGTHFNIMAYKDEAISKVTLIEGAVKVKNAYSKALLKPGQQAEISKTSPGSILLNTEIDTDQVVAWKDGYFMFANEPVESIMRKISRWYNVDIVYKDNLQDKALWGTVSRFTNVSEVLKRLELTGIAHFKIDIPHVNEKERRIIVMK